MRVLFCSTPGWGHIHPMLPLARAFLARDDEVLWVTAADSCSRLSDAGFETAAAGLGEREALAEVARRFPEIGTLPPPERPAAMFAKLFGVVHAAARADELIAAARSWQPGLVVCEAGEFSGHLAAVILGIPSVTHAFGSLIPEVRVAAAGAAVGPLWEAHQQQPRPYGGCYAHLYLDIYPPSLRHPERAHVPATQDLRPGASAIAAGADDLPALVTGPSERPLVYVTFGTTFGNDALLSRVVEGAGSSGARVLVTVGPGGDPAALGDQPETVHVARYVPQDRILPHCSLVVSHGGSGTFLAAVAAGLPQLCIPQAADQFLNAAACAGAGAGLVLQANELSPSAVAAAVDRLLHEDSFRVIAAALAGEVAAMPAPDTVAGRLHAEYA